MENTQSPVPTFGKIRNAHTRPARDLWAIISAMLFFSWQLALIMIAVNAAIGATVGALVVSMIRRSRTTLGVVVVGAILGAAGFLMGSYVVGWATSMHEAFANGRRLDVAPWGEDLPTEKLNFRVRLGYPLDPAFWSLASRLANS